MPLLCQTCLLTDHPDAEPDDETAGAITCEGCGKSAVCYSIEEDDDDQPRRRRPPEDDDDEPEDELDSTPPRPFAVHQPRPGSNGHAGAYTPQPHQPASSDYWLYLETKPRKITQFRGRPSPGDLQRIEKGSLRVFYCVEGRFAEVLANGGERCVDIVGEPAPVSVPNVPSEVVPDSGDDLVDRKHTIRTRIDTDAIDGLDFSALSDADPDDADEGLAE